MESKKSFEIGLGEKQADFYYSKMEDVHNYQGSSKSWPPNQTEQMETRALVKEMLKNLKITLMALQKSSFKMGEPAQRKNLLYGTPPVKPMW